MKIYYAHCIAIYNTEQERADVVMLQCLGFTVVNPNAPEHKSSDMNYYLDIVRNCHALAFRRLPNGKISTGVWAEIKLAHALNMPVFEFPYYHNVDVLTREETREYIKKRRK